MSRKKRVTTKQAKYAVRQITKIGGDTLAGIARKLEMPKNDWSRVYLRQAIVSLIGEDKTTEAIAARKSESMKNNRHGMNRNWTKEQRLERSKMYQGSDNPNWRGGRAIRLSAKYKEFLVVILDRDNYRCVECGSRGGWRGMSVHHIIPEREAPHLLFDSDNVETLCRVCHIQKHKARGDL